MFLTEDGSLYVMGQNGKGLMGLGNQLLNSAGKAVQVTHNTVFIQKIIDQLTREPKGDRYEGWIQPHLSFNCRWLSLWLGI